ncbi:MAG: diguanylate cyclase [Candidatus Electrothrix sp. AR1]|nr:diguanylate cyclase [Candidatus Electrothrix sp. AR1]
MLVTVAKTLRTSVGKTAVFGRYGGEGFFVFLSSHRRYQRFSG